MRASRPNVLLLMSDQHHPGFAGFAGHDVVQTPNLDKLASRGAVFANAYCTSPLCCPSRMSFLTARHPSGIGCWTNTSQLNSDVPTIAHAFLAGDYETVLSGRMHFVGSDQRHGFQHRLVGDVPGTVHLAAGWKLDEVLGTLADTPGARLPSLIKSGPGVTGYQAYDQAVSDTTATWLRARGKQGAGKPFFLTAGFALPHCPYIAPMDDFAYYASRVRLGEVPAGDEQLHPYLEAKKAKCGLVPTPPLEKRWSARVAYHGLCTVLDRHIGNVLRALEDAGLVDNTIVVYTSDHGEMLGEHGLWWKSTFYDSSARVPLVISVPGAGLKSGRLLQNVSLIDLGPTLLELADIDPLPGVEGRSFGDLLRGRPQSNRSDTVRCELVEPVADGDTVVPLRMIKRGDFKYCYYHGFRPSLFDLRTDPLEVRDLGETAEYRTMREELHVLAMENWVPTSIALQVSTHRAQQRLIGGWVEKTCPPEPDGLWYRTPPENRLELWPPMGPATD